MTTKWIDFKALRERLNAAELLAAYNIKVKIRGDQAQGFCPLPTHKQHDGRPKSPSFSVNLRRGIFQCFSCSATGNLLDLACLLEGMNPSNAADIRKTALLLEERFPDGCSSDIRRPSPAANPNEKPQPAAPSENVVINAPLDFELKNLQYDHPYLLNRGFTPETIQHFGLGFCSKGLMKDRIVIPLHDHVGKLVGYAGRVVDDKLITENNPRYRFPGNREKNGVSYEFQKSRFLYNGFELSKNQSRLVITESFTACWWLWQHGITNVVAVMGSNCSGDQSDQIVGLTDPQGVVIILTDGDDAGDHCAASIFAEVAPRRLVKWAKLPLRKQPADLNRDELVALLS